MRRQPQWKGAKQMSNTRIRNLLGELRKAKAGGLLVTKLENVEYLSGYTGSFAAALIGPGKPVLFTDSRYKVQAKAECPGFTIRMVKDGLCDDAIRLAGELQISRLAFESDGMLVSEWKRLRKVAREAKVTLCPTQGLTQELRNYKDDEEISRLKAAAKLTDKAWAYILPMVKQGVREIDLALELETFIRRNGGLLSFDCIVVSGKRSALPHGKPSEKKLANSDFVTFDFGARVGRYCADMTRTVVIGKASAKHKEIYATVLEAQEAALRALKPGAKCREIDRVARDIIRKAGYGKNFGHGLGHSLGILTHDGQRLSPRSVERETLQANMVFTIEPGIYLEGWGGCRIEDDALITDRGCEIITKSPKSLLVV
jgi:Xaa-Pro aminopeptidase